jgi:hypothetical protein
VTWRVQPSGSVRISGRTAAGATISHGGFLRAGRSFWFGRYVDFQKLYDGKNRSYPIRIIDEYLDGEVSLGSGPVQETTTLRWDLSNEGGGFNAPNNGFRWSFRTKVAMQPSRFSRSKPLFAFPTSNGGRLRVTVNSVDREQPPTVAFAELARRFGELRVVSVTPPLQTLRFTRGSSTSDEPLLGAFRGTLQFPGDSIARKFSGVVLQEENIGRGYYEASEVFRLNTGQIRIEVDNDPP